MLVIGVRFAGETIGSTTRARRPMYVCLCKDITDHQLRESIREGAGDFSQVRRRCKVGAKCGKCMQEAKLIVQNELMAQTECVGATCGTS